MSRDGSGNYTLPVGNPVVSGTIIDVNWANPTMADIAQQLNNVITRDGVLGPLVPIGAVDGTQALPGMSFKLAPGTGLWREAAKAGYSYNGVAAWYKDSTGLVVPSNITVSSVNTGPLAGFKNLIINGGFIVPQRGISFTAAVNMAYTLDRWAVYSSGADRTISRQAGFLGAQFCARVQRDNGSVTTTPFGIFQPIESLNCYQLQGKTATVSFSARAGANMSGPVTLLCYSGTTADQGAATFWTPGWAGQTTLVSLGVLATTTAAEFSAQVSIPANCLEIGVLVYAQYTGTAGAADYFEITNVRLEPGAVSTPPEFRPYSVELALCQRYFQNIYGAQITGQANGSTSALISATLPVALRAAATIKTLVKTAYAAASYELWIGNAWVTNASAAFTVSSAENQGFNAAMNGFTGLTSGQPLYFNSTAVIIVTVSSEI